MSNETRSSRDVKCESEEENSRDPSRNQSISERQQESNYPTDNGEIENTKDSDRTLLQNGQEQSNSESRDLEEVKRDTKPRQSIRQTSDGVLREGDGIRNDSEGLRQQENKSNNSNIRYFSMFTGVGGFELGLERANDNKSKITRYETKINSPCNTPKPLQRATFSCVGMS
ncbi:unnamed protein product, partial [marine sediment metagenome]